MFHISATVSTRVVNCRLVEVAGCLANAPTSETELQFQCMVRVVPGQRGGGEEVKQSNNSMHVCMQYCHNRCCF